jgi:hypothetical protein
VGRRGFTDVPAGPEFLEPDDVGSLFGGDRFDGVLPSDDVKQPIATRPPAEWLLEGRTDDRIEAGRNQPERAWTATSQETALQRLEVFGPKELTHGRDRGAVLYGYGIAKLLRAGENTVSVRVAPSDAEASSAEPAMIAVDGQATLKGGPGAAPLLSDVGWLARSQPLGASNSDWEATPLGEQAATPGADLPVLDYRGQASAPASANACHLAVSAFLALAVVGFVLLLFRMGSRWWPTGAMPSGRRTAPWSSAASRVLIPPTVFMIAILFVDLAWAERSERLLLASPGTWAAIGAAALALGGLAAISEATGWSRIRALFEAIVRLRPWSPDGVLRSRALVVAVLLLCAFLRIHDLSGQAFDDDELASVQAATAIARLGVPRYDADVYYSRSPLYHYVVGASVKLFGANFWGLRLPSAVFGTATALLILLAGARLLRSRWTGIAAAVLYATHPYAIFIGRMARFYQQQQFFCFLTVFLFCAGFVAGGSRRHRLATVAAFAAACLSQELSVVLALPLLAAGALFTRRISRREVVELGLLSGCAIALVVLDILVFQTRCLTRLEGISPNVEATLSLHFAKPMNVLTLLLSYSRLHVALSLLLLAGLPLLVLRRERTAMAMVLVLFGGIVGTMLLVTYEAPRYQYWLLPVWILLGVRCTVLLAEVSVSAAVDATGRRRSAAVLTGVLLCAVLLGWSPWRILGSFRTRILGDASSAFAFVRANLRPSDAVAVTEPHPPEGLMDLGRVDYDIAVPLLHDFVWRRDGKLVDRNANAEVLSTLEQLQDVQGRRERLWVLVSREKFRSRGQAVRWDYPGARFEAFLRENLEVKYQTYLWTVFLWDATAGHLRPYRRHAEPQ